MSLESSSCKLPQPPFKLWDHFPRSFFFPDFSSSEITLTSCLLVLDPRPTIIALQNLIFHPWLRKVRFWSIKTVCCNTLARDSYVSVSFQLTTTCCWRFGIRNSVINATGCSLSPMFHGEIAIEWLSIPYQRGGRVTAPFLHPIYREMGDSYLHFTSLEAKKNTNTLLTPSNFAREAFLP